VVAEKLENSEKALTKPLALASINESLVSR